MTATEYARKNLSQQLDEIKNGDNNNLHSVLSIYEQALIYKYSTDGYEAVNRRLRSNKGRNTTNFGKLLSLALGKLPDYNSVVYRKVQLTKAQQNVYKKALRTNVPVREYSFVSTSKVKDFSMLMPGNTMFIISSRTGKDIEKIAKFGYGSLYNEYEVLFQPNRSFEILEIDEGNKNLLTIIMEEI